MTTGDWQRRWRHWLESGDLVELLPEVAALKGVAQPPEYHAEGDVFAHTRLAVESLDPGSDERVFWAVLLHDIGKKATTRHSDGRWTAHGHVQLGAELAPAILQRLQLGQLAEDVAWLIRHHHFALDWGNHVETGLTARQRRLTKHPLFPLLIEVCWADNRASHGHSDKGARLEAILRQLSSQQSCT